MKEFKVGDAVRINEENEYFARRYGMLGKILIIGEVRRSDSGTVRVYMFKNHLHRAIPERLELVEGPW